MQTKGKPAAESLQDHVSDAIARHDCQDGLFERHRDVPSQGRASQRRAADAGDRGNVDVPRCRSSRALLGRKPIPRGRCASSFPFLRDKQPTASRASWVNRCRSGLGRHWLFENRTGACGNIGTEAGVHAPPDGYTLLLAGLSNAMNPTLYKKLNFNFIREIAPVASFG